MDTRVHDTTFEFLSVKREGALAWITLNRPDKANALSYDHLAEIESAALGFREDAETRVVILSGNGNHFSSGADLSEPQPNPPLPLVQARRRSRMGERAIEAILDIDQITIAAWQGAALGGGACIVTACDFRVGAKGCFMQYPEIDLGINLMWKSLPLILNLIGPARAKRLVVGAERLTAEQLLDWGILDELVAPQGLDAAVRKMAAFYASKPPIAAQMIKQSTNQLVNALNHAIMHMDSDQNILSARSKDRQIAIEARLRKEPGEYNGD
jgi:enoyl-CoA hydratase/carnithine racemase